VIAPAIGSKVAVVTGGTRGIGLEVARRLALSGARVVVSGRSRSVGRRIQRELARNTKAEVVFVAADVGSGVQVERLIKETVALWGTVDILVNCAGVNVAEGPAGPTERQWDLLFRTNAKGAWLCCRTALPYLLNARGSIVNVASLSGLVGVAGSIGYAASKSAMINLTRSLALAHADRGLRVNVVCPGPVETDMIQGSWAAIGEEVGRLRARAMCPQGRIADPGEIASAVCFLASEEASFITGAVLAVDGGKSAGMMPAERYNPPAIGTLTPL
jgi:3-oxoacyl-[acyl-carrier protein] reductase